MDRITAKDVQANAELEDLRYAVADVGASLDDAVADVGASLDDAVAEVGALLDDIGARLAALSAPREGDNIELFGIVNPRGEFAFIELDAPGRPALYWKREVAEHELAELQEPGAVKNATADDERRRAELRVRAFRIIPSGKNED